jgi:hypothetical protein
MATYRSRKAKRLGIVGMLKGVLVALLVVAGSLAAVALGAWIAWTAAR